MTCVCDTKYCYICGVDVSAEQYAHFGASLNKCALYDAPLDAKRNGHDEGDRENEASAAKKFTSTESRHVNELIGKLFARNAAHPRVNSMIMTALFDLLPDEINKFMLQKLSDIDHEISRTLHDNIKRRIDERINNDVMNLLPSLKDPSISPSKYTLIFAASLAYRLFCVIDDYDDDDEEKQSENSFK